MILTNARVATFECILSPAGHSEVCVGAHIVGGRPVILTNARVATFECIISPTGHSEACVGAHIVGGRP